MSTPHTSREWARALAAVHPDGPTPDLEAFRILSEQRDAWKQTFTGLCQWCGLKPVAPRTPADVRLRGKTRFCSKACGAHSSAAKRRKQPKLRAARDDRRG